MTVKCTDFGWVLAPSQKFDYSDTDVTIRYADIAGNIASITAPPGFVFRFHFDDHGLIYYRREPELAKCIASMSPPIDVGAPADWRQINANLEWAARYQESIGLIDAAAQIRRLIASHEDLIKKGVLK